MLQRSAGNAAVARLLQRRRSALPRPSPSGPSLQRKLIATGEVERFSNLVEPGIGHDLAHDPVSNEVKAVASLDTPGTSTNLESLLLGVIEHTTQHAEVHFGVGQPKVSLGAFPDQPAKSKVQKIDIDDIERLEKGAPGHGLASLAHEIVENWTAHDPALPGFGNIKDAHRAGSDAGNAVVQDLIDPGAARVAGREDPLPGTKSDKVFVHDLTTYFLVYTSRWTGTDAKVEDARMAERTYVSARPIEGFAPGSDALPPAAAATIAAVEADLLANPRATAHVEGFSDDTGSPSANLPLSQSRADAVAKAIAAGPASSKWLFAIGRGILEDFRDQARNRRVMITVEKPKP